MSGEDDVSGAAFPAAQQRSAQQRRHIWVPLAIAAAVMVADQVTKLWVRSHLLPGESVPDQGFFRLTHVQNTGSAFGLFANQTLVLTLVGIAAVVVLLALLRYQPLRSAWASVAAGLLLGGSLGNLLDRVRLGYVTDFVDVGVGEMYRFYTFNVADSSITVGAIVLAVALLRLRGWGRAEPPPETP